MNPPPRYAVWWRSPDHGDRWVVYQTDLPRVRAERLAQTVRLVLSPRWVGRNVPTVALPIGLAPSDAAYASREAQGNPLEWTHWPWMLGGAAALGAIYWATRPSALLGPNVPPPSLGPGVSNAPVRLPLGIIPLIRGRHYFGIVQPGATVYFFASRAQVVAYAQKKGFTSVQAYVKAAELPAWWPIDGRDNLSDTFWVEGTWGAPSQQFRLPSQVTAAWILGPEILPAAASANVA